MRCVVDEDEPLRIAELVERSVVGRQSEEIDRYHGARAEHTLFLYLRDLLFEVIDVDVESPRMHVNIHRTCTHEHHDFSRGREGRQKDRIVRADAKGHQRRDHRIGFARDREAMLAPGELGQASFALGHFGAHDLLAVLQDALDTGIAPILDDGVLRFEIDERDD